MSDFVLPSLGADMEEGTVVQWRVKAGDTVHKGEIVVLVETEKGIIEVEIWEDATVDEILVEEGTTVDVGTPIARIVNIDREVASDSPATAAVPTPEPAPKMAEEGIAASAAPIRITPPVRHLAHQLGVDVDTIAGSRTDGKITRQDVEAAADAAEAPVPAVPIEPGGRIAASPRARLVAAELGFDLATVPGSGLNGTVTEADVLAAAKEPTPAPAAPAAAEEPATAAAGSKGPTEQQAAMRRAIARVMARSKREIPHYYLGTTIDMERSLTWLDETNAERPMPDRILPAVLLLKASALAIHEVPEVNGTFAEDEFHPSADIHLGVAISLRSGGLIAPAIHHADRLSLGELMDALRDLVKRTRSGGLRGSEMADPTITVTNLGDRGVEAAFPVIYAPQVAMVGFGKVMERPWAVDGLLAVRPVVSATLAGDHRVTDGHRGGLYLAAIERLLQKPEEL